MVAVLVISSITIWFNNFWAIAVSFTGALAILIIAYAHTVYPPEFTTVFTIPCYALRFLLPLAILFLYRGNELYCRRVLIIGTALTFSAHGAKALFNEVIFIDYLLAFFYDIGVPVSVAAATTLLHIIGTIDIALSHHILFFRIQRIHWVLKYMVFWGLVSALARVTFSGLGAWHEVTIRAQHYLVPLALLLMISRKPPTTKEKN